MSEREKNIIRRLSDTVPKLDKEEQNYLLGYAEGMADAKGGQGNKQLQEEQRGGDVLFNVWVLHQRIIRKENQRDTHRKTRKSQIIKIEGGWLNGIKVCKLCKN